MEVRYKRSFLKQLAKLPAQVRSGIEAFAFDELPTSQSLISLGKVEKMRGYLGYYKVRFGSYRVGLATDEGGVVTVMVVLHRREIYRYFP